MTPAEQDAADYREFRGRCHELSQAACAADPTLTLVRGHYFCPLWNVTEPHWWTVRADGSIHDPSCRQFPSNGHGDYIPFDGTVDCAECGKTIAEANATIDGRHAFCSYQCHGRFIGML